MHQFQRVNKENVHLVKDFLAVLGDGAASFRYFAKRPVEIVLNHLLTVVMLDDQESPVAYGHLDKEGAHLWLGIAVAQKTQGAGLGKEMLHYLIDYARTEGEASITLTVDKHNTKAIQLYEANNFVRTTEKDHYYQYLYELE